MKKTVQEAYVWLQKSLSVAGIEEAHTESAYILDEVLGIRATTCHADPGREVSPEDMQKLEAVVDRRSKHEPLQQILGKTYFYGYSFRVNADVLCPRPETEGLIESVIPYLKSGMRLLDVCTGSGAILLTLLNEARRLGMEIEGTGTDVSEKALAIARENAKHHALEATFLQGDLLEPAEGAYDIMTINPPYIKSEECNALMPEVRDYEPRIALDGGEDGLLFYRRLAKEVRPYLKKDGWLFMEIGYDQGKSVPALFKEAGFLEVEAKKDLAGLWRVVTVH